MKRTIAIPYHTKSMELHIDEDNLKAVIESSPDTGSEASPAEIVRSALLHPTGTPPLRELARGKKRITIVTSDHTRPMPSNITMPILLEELRAGNSEAAITILIATGLHRKTTEEEQRQRFGNGIVDTERIVVNDAFCQNDFQFIEALPSGAELWVNKEALNCDLLITEGFIEPHFFAGFSGGRKSILPGICNAATVNENHSYGAIASPYAMAGVLSNNPIHIDMLAAARAVNVQFILNIALDDEKRIAAAFAGDLEMAHAAGVSYVEKAARQPCVKGDIVITSNGGHPLDQNLYQSPKAVAAAEACCREGGIIIMCCSCADGMGGDNFERLMTMGTVDEIDQYLSSIPAKETIAEQWCAQIYARILKKRRVILTTDFLDHDLIRKANMIPAATVDEALELAYSMIGADASVVVVPNGVSVLIVKEECG